MGIKRSSTKSLSKDNEIQGHNEEEDRKISKLSSLSSSFSFSSLLKLSLSFPCSLSIFNLGRNGKGKGQKEVINQSIHDTHYHQEYTPPPSYLMPTTKSNKGQPTNPQTTRAH
ncbi:hypothetical protein Dimus_038080 [Dionaea muscipula]